MRRRNAGPGCALKIGCLVVILVFILAGLTWFLIQANCIRYIGGDLTGGTLFETESRDYYALKYSETDTSYYLEEFYENINGKWVKRDKPLPLEKDVYQYIRITKNAIVHGR